MANSAERVSVERPAALTGLAERIRPAGTALLVGPVGR